MIDEQEAKEWQGHKGKKFASANGFDVIDCECCKFKHIIPIPTIDELDAVYEHEYYNQEKPLYLERYKEDLDWWNAVYKHRYEILENFLPENQRDILDIGSGPGFFLLNGQKRGWKSVGIEPSIKAATHSSQLGLRIINDFYAEHSAQNLGKFDAVNMSLVLEHIPNPANLLRLVHGQLNSGGLISLVVPNDFNPFQNIANDDLGFGNWWVAPPHHINYFDFESLADLLTACGFEVIHQEATFPIDMFLLMGEKYIANDEVGRLCHSRRMNFERAITQSGNKNILNKMYTFFASQNIGREVVMFARAI